MKEKTIPENKSLSQIVNISIPIMVVVGILFHMPQRFIIPCVILAALVSSSTALWQHANEDADGSEWWQDNDASGWRGY